MPGSEETQRLPTAAKINLAALAVLGAALVGHLWPDWTHDPDLSHGFLMPVACVLLLYLSRRADGEGALAEGTSAFLAVILGAAALAGLWVAGLLAASLDWASPAVSFTLACSFAALGCCAVAAFADRGAQWVPFAWPAIAAAALWALSSPLPPGTYTRLTLWLQLCVSGGVMRTLGLLGIAAHREGNIIELARGTVGIEEACSGVRSLISCVFAGLLFSAALVTRPWARALLVALSVPLALSMNFLRSLALTLLVNAGVHVEGAWHDTTGYAVLGVTAAFLLGLAILLERGAPEPRTTEGGQPTAPAAPAGGRTRAPQAALAGVLALVVATLAFFAANTTAPDGKGSAPPDLLASLPAAAPGWTVETNADVNRFAAVLRTHYLAQRTYLRATPAGREQITLYLAYWPPGDASIGFVGSHTPDACWPGAGWMAARVADPMAAIGVAGRPLPPAQHRLFSNNGYPQNVWYWQLDDGRVVDVGSTRSVGALLGIALRFGFRKGGAQMFIRISSNRAWDEISGEPLIADFLGRARSLGLR
ncbi:MAG TPA: exosortase/archaeosortase family protein [Opitutaceae bacterium]